MTCPVCGPAKRKKTRRRARQARDAATWEAVSAAIGLLTARDLDTGVGQAEILGDVSPERAISALEIIAGALLKTLAPGEAGAGVLKGLGLLALEEVSRGDL